MRFIYLYSFCTRNWDAMHQFALGELLTFKFLIYKFHLKKMEYYCLMRLCLCVYGKTQYPINN